jgi:hypothetical protein
MNRKDIAAGLALAMLGMLIIWQARGLTYLDDFGPGPGFLPFWLALLISALSLCLAVFALRNQAENVSPVNSPNEVRRGYPRALLAWLGMIAMVGTMEVLGFIASFALFSFFLVCVIERRSLSSATAVAVGIALGFYLLFRVFLPVPLPTNPWGL